MATISALLLLLLAGPEPSKAEQKLLAQVGKAWHEYAVACTRTHEKEEALRAWTLARDADPSVDPGDELRKRIDAIDGEPKPSDARRTKAHRDVAKLYDKLAKYDDGYLLRALELEPSKKRAAQVVRKIKAERDTTKAGALLARLRAADPEGDYDDLEADLARKDVVLIRAKDHAMVGWLSLPKDWKPKKRYPVLVTVDGAGSNFLGACRASSAARGGRDWIVLAPCGFANTNALEAKKYPFYEPALLERMGGFAERYAWDRDGLVGLLAAVGERFGGEEAIGITGFSGGGNLCYGFTLEYPERVRFAVPACANFSGLGAADAPRPANGGPPVFIYTGAADPHREWTFGKKDGVPGIEPQTDRAVQVLAEKGFTRVKREMLDGVKHSALHAKVWEVVDDLE